LSNSSARKAVHHAHHDHQGGDAEGDGEQADAGDEEDEPLALARQQIAPRDHALVAGKDHWCFLQVRSLRAKSRSSVAACLDFARHERLW
jgi:hypothetical protein